MKTMKRIHIEIILGTLFIFLSIGILTVMSVEEEGRLAIFKRQQKASQIEFGAGVYEINCTGCHGQYAQGTALAPCLRCEEFFTTRLEKVGWEGSLEDYIVAIVSTGQQVSTRPILYPGGGSPAMPTWSDQFGGPLREDQIRALAAFIVSFEEWALNPELVPTPVVAEVPSDDPVALGRQVFNIQGCTACHTVSDVSEIGVIGPVLDGIATRAGEAVEGLTAEEYIRESILDPNTTVVEGFNPDIMPKTYGASIPEEALENLIAFMMSLE